MTAESFRAMRRQIFLTEAYFDLNLKAIQLLTQASLSSIQERAGDHSHESSGQDSIFVDKLNLLKINYTAGCAIEELQPLFAEVMRALGEYAAEHEYSKWLAANCGKDLRVDMTPVRFEDLFHFQLAIDVVSLAVLLGKGGALRQIAIWMSSARGTDILFEFLISPAVRDQRNNRDFFHAEPYDPLIDAFYTAETPEESSAFVKKYLEGWYKSFEGVPWHNGHLLATPDYVPYFCYWSFEAAAVCVIHGIDDSSFRDHIVYPKDLADWARESHSLARLADSSPRRCEAGQPCPRAGWWFTPARTDSRRHYKVGEIMPKVGGDYGQTIWQWDPDQG